VRGLSRLMRIVAFDDVPVGLWAATRGEAEDRFERDVPMEATVVAKNEFIEVNVDVFAPQAMIRAQRPALHQRKSTWLQGRTILAAMAPGRLAGSIVRPERRAAVARSEVAG